VAFPLLRKIVKSTNNFGGRINHQLILSESQLNLILKVLVHEQKELLVEIRHTGMANVRTGLEERVAMVGTLIRRAQISSPSRICVSRVELDFHVHVHQ